jgi:TonB-linked SusC/RagA family outer membrane protein
MLSKTIFSLTTCQKIGLLVLLGFLPFTLFAQQINVTGKVVTDSFPKGLQGVKIVVKETNAATTTDKNGAFQLKIKGKKATLFFSLAGYQSQETTISGKKVNLTIDLQRLAANLSDSVRLRMAFTDTVELPYQIKASKRVLTQSIATTSTTQNLFDNSLPLTFDQTLQGRVAGVQVTQANGLLASAVQVRIRGNTSLGSGGEPLYVIDGIPFAYEDFSNRNGATNAFNLNPLAVINPTEIESVTFLKDASTALYGARGANGVILVTTKKGTNRKTQFSLNVYTGVSQATNKLSMLNAEQWLQLYNEARANDGKYGRYATQEIALGTDGLPLKALTPNEQTTINGITFSPSQVAGVNTNWIDELLQSGSLQVVDFQAKGGNEKTKFFANLAYRNDEGFLKNNTVQRLNGRMNLQHQATEKLDFSVLLGMSYFTLQTPQTSFNGGLGLAQSAALPIFAVRNANGTFFGTQTANDSINPVGQLSNEFKNTTWFNTTSLSANYKFSEAWQFRSTVGVNLRYQNETDYFSPAYNFFSVGNSRSWLNERNLINTSWTTSHVLTFDKKLQTWSNLQAQLGFEAQANNTNVWGLYTANGAGFLNNYFTYYANSTTIGWGNGTNGVGLPVGGYNDKDYYRFVGWFGRAKYSHKDKYFVEVFARLDGSSLFGSNKRYGVFPALSAGWTISEEEFAQKMAWLSFLKLRSSVGLVGGANLPTFTWLGAFSPTVGYLGNAGIQYSRLPNPDAAWTQTLLTDFAVDFALLRNKVWGTIGVYQKNISSLFTERQVQVSATGFKTVQLNDPDITIRERGVELDLGVQWLRAKKSGDFAWQTSFNITHSRNIVTSTGGLSPDILAGNLPTVVRIVEGYPIGTAFVAKSVGVDKQSGVEQIENPSTGQPEGITLAKSTAYRQAMGNPIPDFYGGLNNSWQFKGLEINVLLSFVYGNTIYDDAARYQLGAVGQWNQRSEILNRWQSPVEVGDGKTPRLSLDYGGALGGSLPTSRFLFDGSFVRLRTVSVAYNLPKSICQKLKLSNAKVYVMAHNLMTFSAYKGWDAEVLRSSFSATETNLASQAPFLATPQAKMWAVGLQLGF